MWAPPEDEEAPYLSRARTLIEAAIRQRWAEGLITRGADLGGNQAPLALTFELILEIVYRARCPEQSKAAAIAFRDLAPDRPIRRLRYIVGSWA